MFGITRKSETYVRFDVQGRCTLQAGSRSALGWSSMGGESEERHTVDRRRCCLLGHEVGEPKRGGHPEQGTADALRLVHTLLFDRK